MCGDKFLSLCLQCTLSWFGGGQRADGDMEKASTRGKMLTMGESA